MRFRPLGLRVFARRNKDWESKIIHRPNNPDKQSLEVTIVEVGESVTCVSIGDKVAIGRFGQYQPPKFDMDKNMKYEDCVIVNLEDILGIIETEEVKNGRD